MEQGPYPCTFLVAGTARVISLLSMNEKQSGHSQLGLNNNDLVLRPTFLKRHDGGFFIDHFTSHKNQQQQKHPDKGAFLFIKFNLQRRCEYIRRS